MASNKLNINKEKVGFHYGDQTKVLSNNNVANNPGAFMVAETPIENSDNVRHDIYVQGKHIAGGYGLSTYDDLKTMNSMVSSSILTEEFNEVSSKPEKYYYLKNENGEISIFYYNKLMNKISLSDVLDSDAKIYLINGNSYTFDGVSIHKISDVTGGEDIYSTKATGEQSTLSLGNLVKPSPEDIKGKTFSLIFDMILFDKQPEWKSPSIGFAATKDIPYLGNSYEVGTTLYRMNKLADCVTFDRGYWNNGNGNNYMTGTTNTSFKQVMSLSYSQSTYEVKLGDNKFTVTGSWTKAPVLPITKLGNTPVKEIIDAANGGLATVTLHIYGGYYSVLNNASTTTNLSITGNAFYAMSGTYEKINGQTIILNEFTNGRAVIYLPDINGTTLSVQVWDSYNKTWVAETPWSKKTNVLSRVLDNDDTIYYCSFTRTDPMGDNIQIKLIINI